MRASNVTRWIGAGLLGLPLYGALTFWSSLHPQPDPNTDYAAWARFVTTDDYVLTHALGSILGLILAIFGTFALGALLATGRAGRLALVAIVLTVLGSALFLPLMGVSTYYAPAEGLMFLRGVEGYRELPATFADTVMMINTLLFVVLIFVGNVLLGVAVWRSGRLPRWAGALWAAAAVLMYPLGLVYAMTVGAQSTPPTVLVGALLIVVAGAWMAGSVLRGDSTVSRGSGTALRGEGTVSRGDGSVPHGSRTPSLRQVVARHPLAAFLVMTFTFAWLIVGVAILSGPGVGLLPIRVPGEVFTAFASILGLALPAFLVTAATDGRAGVRDLLRRSFKWRVGARWYLIALLGLLLVVLLAALPLLGTEPLAALARNWPLFFTVFLPGVLLAFVFVNLAEEISWTGFLQHRLQARRGALLASVMVAPAFALVHLPAFFVDGWISEERTPFSQFPAVLLQVGLMAVFAIFIRVLITWLYNGSGHSVLIVALFHSAFNMVNGQKLTPQLLGLPESLAPLIPQLAVLVLAVLAVVLTRGRLAHQPEPAALQAPPPLATPVAPA